MALRTVCSQGAVFAGNLSDGLRQRVCPVTGHDSIGLTLAMVMRLLTVATVLLLFVTVFWLIYRR
jgi:predicted tellurium resistance membrane protein TerC